MRNFHFVILATTLAFAGFASNAALAQDNDQGYNQGSMSGYNPNCGAWVNGIWVPNEACPNDPHFGRRDVVTGTITSVSGHLVTIERTAGSVVIDDRPALNRRTSGRVAVGREIVAHGFWRDGTFFATAID
jgi:hypothetical protein